MNSNNFFSRSRFISGVHAMPRKLIGAALLIAFAGLIIHVCAALVRKDIRHMVPTLVRWRSFDYYRFAGILGDLDTALRSIAPAERLIPVGGIAQVKPAVRLMTLPVDNRDVVGNEVLTSYTRGLECVQLRKPGARSSVAFSHDLSGSGLNLESVCRST